MSDFDRLKSLQELEGVDWGEPEHQSYVVTNAHRLLRLPLREFTVEDLRFMIGQQVGLSYLIPIALDHLLADPLIEGKSFPGDLLVAVLKADARFWMTVPQSQETAARIVHRALSLLPNLEESEQRIAEKELNEAQDIFQRAAYFARHGRS